MGKKRQMFLKDPLQFGCILVVFYKYIYLQPMVFNNV